MILRTRLLLWYSYLVILLVASAAGAALGFHHLGASIGRVLNDNYRSVRASMTMLESLERQDSAVLALLLGDTTSQELLERSQAGFLEAITAARSNITIDRERSVISSIEQEFAAYCQARDHLLASAPEQPLRAYEAQTFPRFEAVKSEVLTLLELNHEAMIEADRGAQQAAVLRAALHGLLVVVALLSLLLLSRSLNRDIIGRLDQLTTLSRALQDGELGRRAAAGEADEIGIVARQLNTLLDRLQELQGAAQGQLAMHRQLLLGLLADCEPAALLARDGSVVATTLSDAETEAASTTGAALAVSGPPHRETSAATGTLQLRTLQAGSRHVGWLVTRSSGSPRGPREASPSHDAS